MKNDSQPPPYAKDQNIRKCINPIISNCQSSEAKTPEADNQSLHLEISNVRKQENAKKLAKCSMSMNRFINDHKHLKDQETQQKNNHSITNKEKTTS